MTEIKNMHFEGAGNSLWGNSKGVFTVNKINVGYVNWVSYPKDDSNLHASVSMFGPTTQCVQYTDTGIERHIRARKQLMRLIRQEIQAKLDSAGIAKTVPAELSICWSEWGMQPEKGWNFDVGSK